MNRTRFLCPRKFLWQGYEEFASIGSMSEEFLEETVCVLCQERQTPDGITTKGRFYCSTCDREWILEKRKNPRLFRNVLDSKEKTEFLLDNLSLFSSVLGLEELMSRFTDLIAERLNRSNLAIFLLDVELKDIRLVHYTAKQKSLERVIKRIYIDYDLSVGVFVEAMETGEPRFYSMLAQTHPFYKFYHELTGTKSQLILPIRFGKIVLGVLTVDYPDENYESYREDQEVLQVVVSQFAVSLRNSLLYTKSQKQSKNFQSLHTAALTLSKLYLNNHEEMVRMILLTLTGIVEASCAMLLERKKDDQIWKGYKISRNASNFQIDSESFTRPSEDVISLLGFVDTQLLSPSENPLFSNLGIDGREIAILPLSLESDMDSIFIISKQDMRFAKDEMDALYAFVSLAKITMENAHLYKNLSLTERIQKEIEIAKEIQNNLLPKNKPEIPGYQLAGFMAPAQGIGGDYYDFILSPNKKELFVCVGDVSGKGVAAGLVMATVRTILHSLVRVKDSTWEILEDINSYLYSSYRDAVTPRFMSMILLRWNLETNEALVSGAGHGSFFRFNQNTKSIDSFETGGILLGIKNNISDYKNETAFTLLPGEGILLYTDGVTEALDSNEEQFSEERLAESLRKTNGNTPESVLESIFLDLVSFSNGTLQHDDITMVCLNRE